MEIANSLAYPLLMAPINKLDDEETIKIKLQSVYRFLDIFTVSRSLNYKSITQTAIRYTIYSLVKEIRNKGVEELKSILKGKLQESVEGLNNLCQFHYRYEHRQFIHYLFARMIYYVETIYKEKKVSFLDLLPSRKKSRLVLAPIIDLNVERYGEHFNTSDELFYAFREIGNYVLIPYTKSLDFNSSYDLTKLQIIKGDYLFTDAIVEESPQSNQLMFSPLANLDFKSVRQRTDQLGYLAQEIWNPELI